MNLENSIMQMKQHQEILERILSHVDSEQAKWKPAPQRWSILEVTCHLDDEERDDFRLRLSLLLEDPKTPWPPIDPPAWAMERNYNEKDLLKIKASWVKGRDHSLEWLKSLKNPDWTRFKTHPVIGDISAGDLLASWVAHDMLHIRQLLTLKLDWMAREGLEFSTRYAMP